MIKLLKPGQSNNQTTDHWLAAVAQLMPAVLSFGPFLMFMGLQGILTTQKHGGTPYLFDYLIALAGVLSVSLGLVFLFVRQSRIVQRLDRLERQKTPPRTEGAGDTPSVEGLEQ